MTTTSPVSPGFAGARRAVGLAHDDLDDHRLHRGVHAGVRLALGRHQHHLAAAVGLERGTERLLDRLAIVRPQALGADEHGKRRPTCAASDR